MFPKRLGNRHFRRLEGGLYLVFWVFLGILFAHSNYVKHGYHDVPGRYIEAVLWGVVSAGIFVIFVPLIVHIFYRFPFEQTRWKTVIAVHIFAAILFAMTHSLLLHIISYSFCAYCQADAVLFGSGLLKIFIENIHVNLLVYGSIVGGVFAVGNYKKQDAQEKQTRELKDELHQLKMRALNAQLTPHFLFNALNTISALVYKDPDSADRSIAALSELLRTSLETSENILIPLTQELDFLKRYLDIMRTRFQKELEVKMRIADEAINAEVPHLILQPLVENAIIHGKSLDDGQRFVEILVEKKADFLLLTVSDHGPGFPRGEPPKPGKGVGISNTRQRLKQLYGSEYRFFIQRNKDRGADVKIALPFRNSE